MAGPVLSRLFQEVVPPQLVFVVEDSASMGLGGSDSQPDRWQRALQTIGEVDSLFGARGIEVTTRVFQGNGIKDLLEMNWPNPPHAKPQNQGTDLSQLLFLTANRLAGDPVQAVVLLSDGQETGRQQKIGTKAPLWPGAALFVAGVGDPQGSFDRLIKDLRYPESAYQGDRVTIEATVIDRQGSSPPGGTLTAWLREGEKVVAQVTVPVVGSTTKLELSFVPEATGLKMLDLEVSSLDNERFLANNKATLGIDVHKARARVLLLAERPGWNVRFLSQAASSENRLGLEVVYAAAGGLVVADSLTHFSPPESVQDWLEFDAVILSGYRGVVSGWDFSLLSQAVVAGLGLFVLPDPLQERTGFQRPPTGLAGLLPVVLEQWERGLVFAKPDSAAYGHPVFSGLLTSPGSNPFTDSPPMAGIVRGQPKEGARVLLEALHNKADESTGNPLLVIRQQGSGRVAFWAGNRLWEMAFWDRAQDGTSGTEQKAVKQLMRNLLIWIAEGTSESGLSFTGRRPFYFEGEDIVLAAQWRDMRGEPVDDGRLRLEVRRIADTQIKAETKSFPVRRYDPLRGQYEFQLPAMPPGRYAIQLVGQDDPVVESPREELLITSHSVEQTQVRQDSRRLAQLADRLDGSYHDLHQGSGLRDLETSLEKLAWETSGLSRRKSWYPTAGWPFLVMVVLLLGCEWFLRRRHGLL